MDSINSQMLLNNVKSSDIDASLSDTSWLSVI